MMCGVEGHGKENGFVLTLFSSFRRVNASGKSHPRAVNSFFAAIIAETKSRSAWLR